MVEVAINAAAILIALILIAAVGKAAFNVSLPREGIGFIVVLAFGLAAMLGLGSVVASVARTGKAANALGTLLFFPLMFFAGLWIPRPLMPAGLRGVSDYTPLGATVAGIQEAMRGTWPHAEHLIVLALYAIVSAVAAARLFRWE